MNTAKYEAMAAQLDMEAGLAPSEWDVQVGTESIPRRTVELLKGCDLKPQAVAWLWKYWLALGKFHILAGAPGQGKTTIAVAAMATVTTGGCWPDGSRCEAGNVLMWSAEDDAADTLLPRFLAAGGNSDRVYFIDSVREPGGGTRPFDPAGDMRELETAIEQIGNVRLIVVDPVVSAVNGDSHKNTEVRRALQPLVDLAGRVNAAVLGITHFSKGGQGSDPASRVVGSIAFTAVARVVLVAAKVTGQDGEQRRIMARGKSNIGPDDGGFEYHLEQTQPLPGIDASYIAWGQAVDGTAQELLSEPEAEGNKSCESDAMEMLRSELTEGWTPSTTASKALADAGFTKKQIRTAGNKLGIQRKKGGMGEGWYWRLIGLSGVSEKSEFDEGAPEGAEDAHHLNVGTLGTFDQQRAPSDAQVPDDSEVFL